ncbi:MAG TPA: polysaccharide pyruvyl transferase family protein [Vicinamibacterales bacterium]|nr:polysaccharide pyruvyl transferase family protein [Vicinamibacterales bacterium]
MREHVKDAPHLCFPGIAPTIGDAAIGQSILQALKARTRLPIRVLTPRPDIFRALPELDDADIVRTPLPPVPLPAVRTPALPFRLRRLLTDLRTTGGAHTLPHAVYAEMRDTLEGCAAVVIQGGPNWTDRMLNRRKVLERWLFLEAAHAYGCRIYHVGVSCGPFAWGWPDRLWMAPLTRRALDCHDILFVRDGFSRPALHRLGVSTRIVESTDAAVFLKSRPDPAYADIERRIQAHSSRPRVVVCTRDYQPAYPEALRVRHEVYAGLARVLDHVQRELADVFFLSTDHTPQPHKRTDVEVARTLRSLMRTPGSVLIDVEVRNPSALKHLYGRFDAMISMRLHPTVLALDHGVPCLLLSYDAKCDDFFTRLDLGEYVVPLAAFRPNEALDCINRMLCDEGLRHRITGRYAALRRAHASDWEPMYEQIAWRARQLAARSQGTQTGAEPRRIRVSRG